MSANTPVTTQLLVIIHLILTSMMTGVIWFVQVVHYPLFHFLGDQFTSYVGRNRWQTAFLLVPLMALEAVAALLLVIKPPLDVGRSLTWLGFVLLAFAWLSTFFLQLPCHIKLSQKRDERILRRLIETNWLRTALWSARCFVAAGILVLTIK